MREVWKQIDDAIRDCNSARSELEAQRRALQKRLEQLGSELAADWSKLSAELEQASAGAAREQTAARQRLETDADALRAKLRQRDGAEGLLGQLDALERSWGSAFDALKPAPELQRARTQVDAAGQAEREQLTAAAGSLPSLDAQLVSANQSLTQHRATLARTVEQFVQGARGELDALERRALSEGLDRMPAQIAKTKLTLQQQTETAKAPLTAAVDRGDSALEQLSTSVLGPIKQARTTLEQGERTVQTLVDGANKSLDALVVQGVSQVRNLVKSFNQVISQAMDALDGVNATVKALRGTVLPPIDALKSALLDVKQLFDGGVSLLQGVLDGAVGTLDAIPATGLPKPLVQGAMSAIQSAVSTLAPQIQTASQQASQQITNLTDQIANQVDTAKTKALSSVSSFSSTTGTQIDAVVPQVSAQMQTVQSQVDALVAQIVAQVGTIQTQVTNNIRTTKSSISDGVTQALNGCSSTLDQGSAQLSQTLSGVRTQIGQARTQLQNQATAAAQGLQAQIDSASQQVTSATDALKQRVQATQSTARTQTDAVVKPVQAQLASVRTQASQAGEGLDERASQLKSVHQGELGRLRSSLPTPAQLAQPSSALEAQFQASLQALAARADSA